MSERGEIKNLSQARQVPLFSGIKIGNITPTDIDLFMDYHNELFIFAEVKLKGTEIARGQKLAIKRLCDNCEMSGKDKKSIAFIAEHSCFPPSDIDMANAIVTEYRYNFKWRRPESASLLLVDAINNFISKYRRT